MNDEIIIPCPTCKKSQRWTECGEHKPFCSKRCQLIDLGEWVNESHSIAGESVSLPENPQSDE
jgi:endogenous inhibitor of DNA gyrase (YacG/DUF329 family)